MISRSAMHALRAVIELALLPPGTFAGAGELARRIHAPANYLGKLLQTLAGAGILESRRGLGGGFCLARLPSTITLYQVVEPIDNIGSWEGCMLGLPVCDDGAPCAVHERWDRLRKDYIEVFSGTTVADLAEKFDSPAEGPKWAPVG